ncbi:hypothetical protein TraAM80_06763 [Trypanosoma rangeli]|uniref:Uncharacterized protein n=1 Tax=Trypanosoma rangeli TaxID=5698 RepID=A0A422N8L5_TRYRA|nr:uncharacterized protein TraAM80_06763 [Trypanosoma rangeli]RNF01828.1 hypothetical protein TraAM80_06763 [Trypanosoma rangeli]|eukprot:RNF01828.1 hypothetical protein TraAM80_06763 [Trypanosoma rangeli]
MTILPQEVDSKAVLDERDSASSSSMESEGDGGEESADGAVVPLDVMYAMTHIIQKQDDEISRLHRLQETAREEEMLRRRELLRERVASVRHLLAGTKEPIGEEGCRPNAVSISIEPSNPDSELSPAPVTKLREHLPWHTRLWHSVYNNIRFLVVTAAYTTGANIQATHAPNEYYHRKSYSTLRNVLNPSSM